MFQSRPFPLFPYHRSVGVHPIQLQLTTKIEF